MADFKFNCPRCKQSLEAPQEMLGQTVNCPSCQAPIKVPNPQTQRPASLPPQARPPPEPPMPSQNPNLFSCPDCGKTVSVHAETCPSCGRRFKHVQTPGGMLAAVVLGLLICGIIFVMMMGGC